MKKTRLSIYIIGLVFAAAYFIGCDGNSTDTAPSYTIAGSMMWSARSGDVVLNQWLANVTMSLDDGNSVTTDVNGRYAFTIHSNGTYTVTPSRTGFIFNPAYKTIQIDSANSTDNNFIATYTGSYYIISGTVYGVAGLYDAQISAIGSGTGLGQGQSIGSDGNYFFGGLIPGTYTITPSWPGHTFTPASITVTIDNADSTGNNFVAQ